MDTPENIQFVVDDPSKIDAVAEGKIKLPPIRLPRNRVEPGAGATTQDLPAIDNAADLIGDDRVVLPPEIIPGLIHQGMKASLSGSSKSQKTWLALDLAVSVATGTEFLGFKTRRTEVLYVNLEIHKGFFRERMQAVDRDKPGTSSLDHLFIWTLRGHVVSFDDFLPELIDESKRIGAGLIIIDPIYKLLAGKDENSAGDISELCNNLDRLAVATDAAVLYVAHYSKGNQAGKTAIDRTSGSGVFGRDADTIINLTHHQEPNCLTVEFTLRNHRALDPFVVEWKYPLMVRRRDLNPAQLKAAFSRKKADLPADVILSMVPTGDDDPILQHELVPEIQAQGIGEKRSQETLQALVEEGTIFKWELPRPGTRPAIAYHQQPQPVETPPRKQKKAGQTA